MFGERLAVIRIRQLVYARFPDGPAGGGRPFETNLGPRSSAGGIVRTHDSSRSCVAQGGTRGPSRTCSPGRAADRAAPRWYATGAFSIGPRPRAGRGGGAPRSSIISGNSFP